MKLLEEQVRDDMAPENAREITRAIVESRSIPPWKKLVRDFWARRGVGV